MARGTLEMRQGVASESLDGGLMTHCEKSHESRQAPPPSGGNAQAVNNPVDNFLQQSATSCGPPLPWQQQCASGL